MTVSGVFNRLPASTEVKIDNKLVKHVGKGRKGSVEYAVIRNAKNVKNRVLFLIPGATGESEGGIMQLMSNKALKEGYHVFISNPLAPPDSNKRCDIELIDFTKSWAIKDAVSTMKEIFGDDAEIYAVAFSLGSNHLLRHLGSH